MSAELSGKVAVVTGAASGIGRSVAERFAAARASVVLVDRDGHGAAEAAKAIVDGGGKAMASGADVTDADQLEKMAASALSRWGGIDVLSCNAGILGFPTPALEADPDEFDRILAVNVKGVWLSVRAVAPAIIQRGGGSILVTGSSIGVRTRPGFGAYAASKAAVHNLVQTLALELAKHDVRVNCLAPVAANTPMLPTFLGPDDAEAVRARVVSAIPLGRLAEPSDVAEAALFLASEAAHFVTGVVLPVDGGRCI